MFLFFQLIFVLHKITKIIALLAFSAEIRPRVERTRYYNIIQLRQVYQVTLREFLDRKFGDLEKLDLAVKLTAFEFTVRYPESETESVLDKPRSISETSNLSSTPFNSYKLMTETKC